MIGVIAWADRPLPGAERSRSTSEARERLRSSSTRASGPGSARTALFWTLTPEIGFYIVLPLVAVAFFRRPLAGLAIAAAIAILWREAFDNLVEIADALGFSLSGEEQFRLSLHQNQQLLYWAFSFAAGMAPQSPMCEFTSAAPRSACGDCRRRSSEGRSRRCCCSSTSPGATPPISTSCSPPSTPASSADRPRLHGPLAALMLALAFAGPALQRPFAHPLVRRLADVSYGIFR